jgi:2-deoxy-D-gluconate 3-dehydrogenase
MYGPELFDLSGKVAVVTGGNGGIGRGIALGLAGAGASIAILGRNAEKNQAVLTELKALGGKAMALVVDVTARDSLAGAVQAVTDELGDIDILVNNAGRANISGGILNETAEDWDAIIDNQLNSVFLLSKLVAAGMAERKSGKIINIGSMYSIFGSALVPSYSAAKGAVIQLTKSMAVELAPYNIQVNAIVPGWISTDMTSDIEASEMGDTIVARTPAARWGRADEFAGPAVFLASSAADFITGESLRVDGGYSIN